MSDLEHELRAKAIELYELARRNADSSDGLLYLLRAAECEQQLDELHLEQRDIPGPHMIDDSARDDHDRDNR